MKNAKTPLKHILLCIACALLFYACSAGEGAQIAAPPSPAPLEAPGSADMPDIAASPTAAPTLSTPATTPTPSPLGAEALGKIETTLQHLLWREIKLNPDTPLRTCLPQEVAISVYEGEESTYLLDFSIGMDAYHVLLDQSRHFPVYGLWLTDSERAARKATPLPIGSFRLAFDPAQELEAVSGSLTAEDIASLTRALEYGVRKELDRSHSVYQDETRYLEGRKKQTTLVQVYESGRDAYDCWFMLDEDALYCDVTRGSISEPYGNSIAWSYFRFDELYSERAPFVGEFYFEYDPDCEFHEAYKYFDQWPQMREKILDDFSHRFNFPAVYAGKTITYSFVNYTERYAVYPGDYYVVIIIDDRLHPEFFDVFYYAEEDAFFFNLYTYITEEEILALKKQAFDTEKYRYPKE